MKRTLWYWALFFLLVQVVFEMRGGTNPASRFALMAALTEDHSLQIDAYYPLTVDWAKTPDGHYYSNKAPGPALVGFPIFYALDAKITSGVTSREARDALRIHWRWHVERLLSILLQALPFALLVVAIANALIAEGVGAPPIRFFVAACFFGSTAAMYMNTYFGHGMKQPHSSQRGGHSPAP